MLAKFTSPYLPKYRFVVGDSRKICTNTRFLIFFLAIHESIRDPETSEECVWLVKPVGSACVETIVGLRKRVEGSVDSEASPTKKLCIS